jgi:hypothetical protein
MRCATASRLAQFPPELDFLNLPVFLCKCSVFDALWANGIAAAWSVKEAV